MNTYAAYYVMWGGMDPRGMESEGPRVSDAPAICPLCKCVSISVAYSNDGEWDGYKRTYKDGDKTKSTLRLGNKITSTFIIQGDPDYCQFYQDEEGSFIKTIQSERKMEDGDKPRFPGPNNENWETGKVGVNGNQITEDGEPREGTKLPKGARAGKADVWETGGKVVFTDTMGVDQGILATHRTHLWIRLNAVSRCVSSDGTEVKQAWHWRGKITVYVHGNNTDLEDWVYHKPSNESFGLDE